MMVDIGLPTKIYSSKEDRVLEKQKPISAQQCLHLVKDLSATWQGLSSSNPDINDFVKEVINDDDLLEMLFNEIAVIDKNLSHATEDQRRTRYIVHAVICLVLVMGEKNALSVLEMAPSASLAALKEAVNYTTKPSKFHKYHERFQELVIVDVVTNVAHELFPTRYLYGVVQIMSGFNVSEELMEIILLEAYNDGKVKQVNLQ